VSISPHEAKAMLGHFTFSRTRWHFGDLSSRGKLL